MKKIAISGAGGFVGTNLISMFEDKGFEVVRINRSLLKDKEALTSIVEGAYGVINLAGANIINRWSEEYKKLLYSSRIDTTKALIEAFHRAENKPKVFISTSAVGVYANKREYHEENIEYADDFLGSLCRDWEKEALKAESLGIRTAIFRFGIVMGEGGALKKMLLPFKLGLGGTIGKGNQAFSYIHMDDLKGAYEFVLNNEESKGVYNLTAPNPTTNYGLTKALGKSLKRPTIFPVPEFVLELIFSEGAKVLTDGQSVVPKRLMDEGYRFRFETIEDTIEDLVG